MAITVRHTRVSTKPVGLDPGKIQAADWNADHEVLGTGLMPAGQIADYVGVDVPPGWLECYGQILSAAAYPALFAALVKTAVVTIAAPASPAVVSWPSHGRRVGDYVGFQPTAALPAGIIQADLQLYRIISAGFSTNAFRISLTWEGPPINAGAPGVGAITGVHAPFGCSTGLTQFALPDFRGVVLAGISNMGGTQSAKLASGYSMGSDAGAETVALTVPNLPPHDHSIPTTAVNRTDNPALGTRTAVVAYNTPGNTGLGLGTAVPVNKMQPTEFVKKIIYTGI